MGFYTAVAVIWVVLIAFALFGSIGAYTGRKDMLNDFGMSWDDYRRHLKERRGLPPR